MTNLSFNLSFEDLYDLKGLKKIDTIFLSYLQEKNKSLFRQLKTLRLKSHSETSSEFLIQLAPILEEFLGDFFQIQKDVLQNRQDNLSYEILATVKKNFLQRHVCHAYTKPTESLSDILDNLKEISRQNILEFEKKFAHHVHELLLQDGSKEKLYWAEQYAAWALFDEQGKAFHAHGTLFKLPKKTNYDDLISEFLPRDREGFNCTTPPLSKAYGQDQARYCLYCHKQDKDSCSKGFENQKNPLDNDLKGCPLKQKISEMNLLKKDGFDLGALAVIMIDNPLVPLTGNRICNDCMKACIFQKQDPVDIPAIETQILEQVLKLPWGFEIYNLLCKWNPLKTQDYLPSPKRNQKILVTGMGPAGMGLSYYMLHKGYTVVGIEGLSVQPLSANLKNKPIKTIQDLFEPLSTRTVQGFGGVSEYGITARWNKNFLLVVRLMLERHQTFKCFGNTRLQSTLTIDQAFDLGFDHVALCLGAGRPNTLSVANNLALGVRQASDFLMTLHAGAFKEDAAIPLMIRLPIVVIGGGLTAVDTATEALAYYPIQVEKFLKRFEALKGKGQEKWTQLDKEIAAEFLEHARLLRADKGPKQDLLKKWGGCTLLYRQSIQKSPAYRMNHHELIKAQEEGVQILDDCVLKAIKTDSHGYVESLEFDKGSVLKARTILVATGTHPNTVLAEELESITLKDDFFENKTPGDPLYTPFIYEDDRRLSLWGDLHPEYSGSVVKALASAKDKAPFLCKHLDLVSPTSKTSAQKFFRKLKSLLAAKVVNLVDLPDHPFKITVYAPLQVKNLQTGQFFRLQVPNMKAVPVTGTNVSKKEGTMDFFIKRNHPSAPWISQLKIDDTVPLMGPAGSAFPMPLGKKVLVFGYGFENVLLEDYIDHLKKNKNQVVHISEIPSNNKLSTEENFLKNVATYLETNSAKEAEFVYMAAPPTLLKILHEKYAGFFKVPAFVGLLSPMQCMMKEICAQCLQKTKDPKTGEEKIIYACKNQTQAFEWVDFEVLENRSLLNGVQEKLFKSH